MPQKKLLISLQELQQTFSELPPSGQSQQLIHVPIALADESMTYLEFAWDDSC